MNGGFIDDTGKEITALKYNEVKSFNYGIATVRIDWIDGISNKNQYENENVSDKEFEELYESAF
ncbi:WG repeat-containing protein [Flavobacterium sp. CGRL2]